MTINRNDFEPFNAQELIDNLNAAYAKRPILVASVERSRRAEEAAFAKYMKVLGEWERTVWEPAAEAIRETNIKLRFDHVSGRYYARFDADGRERYAVRVTNKRHFDVMVAANDAEEAKEIALRLMDDEQKIARKLNRNPRFTYETTTEDTSHTAHV